MVVGTLAAEPGRFVAWGLFLGAGASFVTTWWIVDHIGQRDRLRVTELAEIMARVAMEETGPRPPRLSRIH